MANEITTSVSVKCVNGNFRFEKKVANKRSDQTNVGGGGPGTIMVGTDEESVDMAGYRFVWIDNLDKDNFVLLGFSADQYSLRLRPDGPPMLLELEEGQSLFMRADTAECPVDVLGLFE